MEMFVMELHPNNIVTCAESKSFEASKDSHCYGRALQTHLLLLEEVFSVLSAPDAIS
jgi:hypothetical protein